MSASVSHHSISDVELTLLFNKMLFQMVSIFSSGTATTSLQHSRSLVGGLA